MQLGMIGLGRMGANIVRRLLAAGHECVVYDRDSAAAEELATVGAVPATDLAGLVARLTAPRAVWVMVPAAAVGTVVDDLVRHLDAGDVVVDGGNSSYRDSRRRAEALVPLGLDFVDVGTSGGVWGLKRGYCLMIGGAPGAVGRLDPIFRSLAPGIDAAGRTGGRTGEPSAAEHGYLHCGPPGSGHFVKMVHNGVEYGLMAAYAEGFNVLRHADAGLHPRSDDAESAPLAEPHDFRYEMDLPAIAEVWRRGSVVASWLLDLTAAAYASDPTLEGFSGRVSDSGEGRWTVEAAVEEGVPVPVISAALFARFSSRDRDDHANRVLSAMRREFGGHSEPPPA